MEEMLGGKGIVDMPSDVFSYCEFYTMLKIFLLFADWFPSL